MRACGASVEFEAEVISLLESLVSNELTIDALYATDTDVAVGTSVNGATVTFPADAPRPECVRCLLTYTPGVANRELTVTLQVSSTLSSDWFAPLNATFTITGGTGGVPILDSLVLGLPGLPSKMRLIWSSTGDAGADDTVSAILTGLPIGTVIA